jgi:hypothetical protein
MNYDIIVMNDSLYYDHSQFHNRRWLSDGDGAVPPARSPGAVSVGRRESVRPHNAAGRRRSGAITKPGRADVAKRG